MPNMTLRANYPAQSSQFKTDGNLVIVTATVEAAAAAAANTQYEAVRLPVNARISNLSTIYWDDLASTGSPTLDVGFAAVEGNFTTDVDALNDGLDVATAAGSARIVKDHANGGRQVWEYISGATSATTGFADLIVTILDAAVNTGGTITVEVVYSID